MDRTEVLTQALDIVNGARAEAYGSVEDNFSRIAELWSVAFNHGFVASDVAVAMILLKVARTCSGVRSVNDNWVDIAGYAACGSQAASNPGYARPASD